MEWDHFTATILVHSEDQKFGYEAWVGWVTLAWYNVGSKF